MVHVLDAIGLGFFSALTLMTILARRRMPSRLTTFAILLLLQLGMLGWFAQDAAANTYNLLAVASLFSAFLAFTSSWLLQGDNLTQVNQAWQQHVRPRLTFWRG